MWNQLLFLWNVIMVLLSTSLSWGMHGDRDAFFLVLTKQLVELNVLCVKVFQAMALDFHWVDETLANHMMRFTDNAPWTCADIDFQTMADVAEKYGLYLGNGYPINAGMISLVFQVKDKESGNFVILKLKRLNIEGRLKRDMDNMLFLVRLLSFLPWGVHASLAEIVAKNMQLLKHQTNFLKEVDNMARIRENCKHLKYVVIPVANRQVTEEFPNVILMDYIHGTKLSHLAEQDYLPCAKLVVKFGLVTSLLHGLTHGDLHSGNVLFVRDSSNGAFKLGVLDFGLVHKVDPHFKAVLFELVSQLFELPPRECALKILHSGILDPPNLESVVPKKDYDELLTYTEQLIRETLFESRKANQLQLYKFLTKLKSCLAMYGVKPSEELTKSQLVLAMAHGVTLTLCKGQFMELMDTCMAEVFRTDLLWR